MLFDTIQNKHRPYSFSSLLKARIISLFITLLLHGIALLLVLFVVPLVQVNVFETNVLNVIIVPFDPLIFPDPTGIYEVSEELETTFPTGEISQDTVTISKKKEGFHDGVDNRQENPTLPTQEKPVPSSPLISEFRLDKRTRAEADVDQEKSPLLILASPDSLKTPPKKVDNIPGKVVDFNQYLQPELPYIDNISSRQRIGTGFSKIHGRQAQAIIKEAQFDVTPWASVVVERIQKNWIIPSDRENPVKARVGIDVKISKKGDLVEIEVVESSLIQSFDQAALAAIKDSAPYPSLPTAYPGIVLQIYFIFFYND